MDDVDPNDDADCPRQYAWMFDQVGRLDRLFRDHVRTLVPVGAVG